MNHQTVWFEFVGGLFCCNGCSKQCQTCNKKPEDGKTCDGTLIGIQQVIFGSELHLGGA